MRRTAKAEVSGRQRMTLRCMASCTTAGVRQELACNLHLPFVSVMVAPAQESAIVPAPHRGCGELRSREVRRVVAQVAEEPGGRQEWPKGPAPAAARPGAITRWKTAGLGMRPGIQRADDLHPLVGVRAARLARALVAHVWPRGELRKRTAARTKRPVETCQ